MAFQMPDMTSYLNAMMQYWGPLMESSIERARALPARETAAFDRYIRGKRLDEEQQREEILRMQDERKASRDARVKAKYGNAGPTRRTGATAGAAAARIASPRSLLLSPWQQPGMEFYRNPLPSSRNTGSRTT